MSVVYERVAEGVIAIDTEFVRPRMDASHLIVDDGHAAFVDTDTFFSVPNLLAALAAQDLDGDIALNAAGLAIGLARRGA